MTKVLAIGPYSAPHGEGRMFKLTSDFIATLADTTIYDSFPKQSRIHRALNVSGYLLKNLRADVTHVYLSTSRNKLSLLIVLLAIRICKLRSEAKVVYHIHGIELAKNLTGPISGLVRALYLTAVDITLIPNSHLDTFSRFDEQMDIRHAINPFLGKVPSQDSFIDVKADNYFVFVSYPSANKGLRELVKIAEELSVRVKVIGWSSEDYFDVYGEACASTKIELCGKNSSDKTLELLSGSKGLMANSFDEAMPLVLVEAIMCGVPVIVNDCPGYRFFRENFETVVHFDTFRDQKSVVRFSSEKLDVARSQAAEKFSMARYFERIKDVIFDA